MTSHNTYLLLLTFLICLLCCITPVMGEKTEVTTYYDVYSDVNGAAILFDNKYMGQISNGILTVPIVSSEKRPYYLVSARKSGYHTATTFLPEASGEMEHQSVFLYLTPLKPKTGNLSVSSSPARAKLFVDGTERGITPQTLTGVAPGAYRIQLVFPGYETWSGNAVVSVNETCMTYAYLKKSFESGVLSVNSNPAGAEIYLDRWLYGTTPMTMGGISAGSHLIEIKKEGYIDLVRSVNITDSTTTPVTFALITIEEQKLIEEQRSLAELRNKTGTLSLTSTPPGAIVFIDTVSRGATPNTVTDLTPGVHHVQLMSEGYQDYQESVVLSRGEKQSLNITMQTLPTSEFAPLSLFPVILSILVAALFVNHRFHRKK